MVSEGLRRCATEDLKRQMSEYSLGIDIGGTFTDLVIHDHDSGRRWGSKVLTTHADPQQGVVAGVRTILAESGLDPRGIGRVVHATTLFTNALIERKGAPTGLLVTDGFRDMLEIGRERKYDLYDIGIENPAPLVPRNLRLGVSERMRADGSVAEPLDEAQLLRQIDALRAVGVTSVAVVFLHAYANPAHEEQAARAIAAYAPELFVTPSHQVVREIREYERASTTVASAYVKPIAAGYLAALARELARIGIAAPLLLMLSGGGLTHAAEVNRNPVQMLESGPAAGALAAAFFGARDGVYDLLAFDMGGTTAKLSLVDGGEPLVAYGFEAARQKRFIEGSGLPIRLSTIELIEIGAGGGSIARRDEIGLLKVGPDSAGSEPGPACYGGGDRIVLGTPGGGGYGSANLRSTADRERDQKMGYVER
jgi:N-methylhydantoinase A